jgi:actin related protein 2/3 complex subunit 4
MIETAVNSVRISIKVKQIDEMDAILANKFSRMIMQRADNFIVLRRKPMPVRELFPK